MADQEGKSRVGLGRTDSQRQNIANRIARAKILSKAEGMDFDQRVELFRICLLFARLLCGGKGEGYEKI